MNIGEPRREYYIEPIEEPRRTEEPVYTEPAVIPAEPDKVPVPA